MKVPSYIKENIRKNATANETARSTDEKIRSWLMKNNIHDDFFIDQLIDCCAYGNNPEAFIKFLEEN